MRRSQRSLSAPAAFAMLAMLQNVRLTAAFLWMGRVRVPLASRRGFCSMDAAAATGRAARRLRGEQLRAKNLSVRDRVSSGARLAPLRAFTSRELRLKLRLNGREKRARVFVPENQRGSLEALDAALRETFPLAGLPYIVKVKTGESEKRPLVSDQDLAAAIEWADSCGVDLHVYIEPDPSVPEPEVPEYLKDLPPLDDVKEWQVLSFYRFVNLPDPQAFANLLQPMWRALGARGRVYVAAEGINAQMAVPVIVLPRFEAAIEAVDKLRGTFINKDCVLSGSQMDDAERSSPNAAKSFPFETLHIRVRDQVLTDGFDKPLDWSERTGKVMSPEEWHEALSAAVDAENDGQSSEEARTVTPIVLDCRNDYESDVGRFDASIPLNTSFFRESWNVLREELSDVPRNTPLLTYCTGGIRCVKVGAFLEQEMGFTNVGRLEGGVVNYARYVRERGLASRFKGKNYVFDQRMGERVTSDILSDCDQCGEPSDDHVNCANPKCHTRFIQCPKCGARYGGCCSRGCQETAAATTAAAVAAAADARSSKLSAKPSRVAATGATSSAAAAAASFQPLRRRWQGYKPLQSGARNRSFASEAVTPNLARLIEASASAMPSLLDDDISFEETDFEGEDRRIASLGASFTEAGAGAVGPAAAAAVADDVGEAGTKTAARAAAAAAAAAAAPAEVAGRVWLEPQPFQDARLNRGMDDVLEGYCAGASSPEPPLLAELRAETARQQPKAAHMVSSPLQGRLLASLASLVNARRVLEIGTFTGYSALCFAEALPADGRVITCEVDPKAAATAQHFFDQSEHGSKVSVKLGAALETVDAILAGWEEERGACDSDGGGSGGGSSRSGSTSSSSSSSSSSADGVGSASVSGGSGGGGAAKVGDQAFDVVFIDGDKRSYVELYDRIMERPGKLLRKGGLLLADNTLFRGMVPEAAAALRREAAWEAEAGASEGAGGVAVSSTSAGAGKADARATRLRRIAEALHEFNEHVKADTRTEQVLLPIRDGLTIIRWKG